MRTLHRDTADDSDFLALLFSGRRPCDDVPLLRREISFIATTTVDFPLREEDDVEDGVLLMVDDNDDAVPLIDEDDGVVEGSTRITL